MAGSPGYLRFGLPNHVQKWSQTPLKQFAWHGAQWGGPARAVSGSSPRPHGRWRRWHGHITRAVLGLGDAKDGKDLGHAVHPNMWAGRTNTAEAESLHEIFVSNENL